MCIPNFNTKAGNVVRIPHGKGLIGKIRLQSSMEEDEKMREIRSVFSVPMDHDNDFRFQILQSSGGAKSLTVPARSLLFQWTAQAIAGSSKSPIYILAVDDLKVAFVI